MFGIRKFGKSDHYKGITVELNGEIPKSNDQVESWIKAIPNKTGIDVKNIRHVSDKKILFDVTCNDAEGCSDNDVKTMIAHHRITNQEPFHLTNIKFQHNPNT